MTHQVTRQAERRKHELLTHTAPSEVRSITDAAVIKSGPLYLVTHPGGEIPSGDRHGYGFYFHDCRFLCAYELRIGEESLDVLAASAAQGFGAVLQLSNPPLRKFDVPEDRLAVRWTRVIDRDAHVLHDRLSIDNHCARRFRVPLSLNFDADFRDVFLVRGLIEAERGTLYEAEWAGDRLVFGYDGVDGVRRITVVGTIPAPDQRSGSTAVIELDLEPGGHIAIDIGVAVMECRVAQGNGFLDDAARLELDMSERQRVHVADIVERESERWQSSRPGLETDSLALNAALKRSVRDLGMMVTSLEGLRFYAAGVPWFVTLYGRDSLLTPLLALPWSLDIAADTLRLVARYQGRTHDPWRDEQPGKMLHELRVGELAQGGVVPYMPYYGSVDSAPLFLILLAQHATWTGSMALLEELSDAVDAALTWMTTTGVSENGFISYDSVVDGGIVNQGWKDSGDAIIDEHGRIAEPPIALIEVQAYAWRAALEMSRLFRRCGGSARADSLEQYAADLRARVDEQYWCEEMGTYAMALDGTGRPLPVCSSNPAHALWAGLPDRDRGRRIAERLMQPDMFSGWGVRTLSCRERGYNPVGYHIGTVWPHDNALIAAGLRRYGADASALRILEGLVSATSHFEQHRLPELFAGYGREDFEMPVRYPVACHPQAWAAAAVPALMVACLGLRANGFDGKVRLVDPVLPAFVKSLRLTDLQVGGGSCDLSIDNDASGLDCRVERADGLQVKVERTKGNGGVRND